MNKAKDKSNGSEQKGTTAVAERGASRSDGRDEILAYRRPPLPSGWLGNTFPMVRRLADEFDRVFEGFGFPTNSLLRSPWTSDGVTGCGCRRLKCCGEETAWSFEPSSPAWPGRISMWR